jgi:hypothetical protein
VERLFFLDVVGRARTLHLSLLAAALRVTEVPESFYMGSVRPMLLEQLPEVDRDLAGLAWNDLERWGFVGTSWSGLATVVTRDAAVLADRVTPLGRRFVGFVTVPE